MLKQRQKGTRHTVALKKDYILYGEQCSHDAKTRTKHKNYKYYGMRGIRVCEEWHQYENFREWAVARDDYSPETTLDRIDSNGNYEPSNCRFETSVNQVINRRSTIWVDYNGERIPLRELVEKSGIPRDILRHRLQDGWDVEKAISTPVTKYNTKNKENTDFKE